MNVGQVYDQAKEVMPQVKGQEYKLRSSERNLAIARSYYSPAINLSASYGSGYSDAIMRQVAGAPVITEIGYTESNEKVYAPINSYTAQEYSINEQLKDNKSFGLTLGLTVPIFNQLQVKTAIDNARINLWQTQVEYEQVNNQLYRDIQQAHVNATAALKKYLSSQSTVASTEEAFRYTEQKYEVGNVNSVDYAVAKNNLLKARSDLLQAKYEYIFSIKILDFYMGKKLEL